MIKRTISSAIIVLVTLGFFLLRTINYKLFDLYTYGIAIACTLELLKAYKEDITKIQKILVMAFTITVFPVMSFIPNLIIYYVAGYVSLLIFVSIITSSLDKSNGLYKTVFATFYPTIPLLSMIILNVNDKVGVFYLLTALTVPAFTDVGAYLIGSALKGKKLCPNISPNKTISGAIGGVVCGIIATILTYFSLKAFDINLFYGAKTINVVIFLAVSGIFLSVIAQIGDLVESYIKRGLGIKDMGNVIPGHGGILDRVDGLVFTSLFTWILYFL